MDGRDLGRAMGGMAQLIEGMPRAIAFVGCLSVLFAFSVGAGVASLLWFLLH